MTDTFNHRSGFVAIAGCPNVGKSTLLNQLLGERIAIATPMPQTTRHTLRGILTLPGAQVVFLDTPGFHDPRSKLNEAMVRAAAEALEEVDLVLFLVDGGRPPGDGDRAVATRLAEAGRPVVLVINKWDRVPEEERDTRLAQYQALGAFDATQCVCALEAAAAAALLPEVIPRMADGPPFYPEEQLTDQTLRQVVAELVREQVIRQCADEVPHQVAVGVDRYLEDGAPDPDAPDKPRAPGDFVMATIYVERDSQKGIIIGKGGRRIKAIGQSARFGMERITGHPVHLKLFVKLRENWRKDTQFLREMGFRC